MDPSEQAALAKLPEMLPIYRGVCHQEGIEGLSWTLKREQANWFARRFSRDKYRKPIVVTGTAKEAVLAYFNRRNEAEMVILPEDVTVLRAKTLAPKQMRA